MNDLAKPRPAFVASAQLDRLIDHYASQKIKWMNVHYSTKLAIILLAASIPVMTTIDSWPWTIAIVGSLIAALEGISQLWHFHERYVAARMLLKALERERIVFAAGTDEYESLNEDGRARRLASRMSTLLDRYESEVLSVLKKPGQPESDAT